MAGRLDQEDQGGVVKSVSHWNTTKRPKLTDADVALTFLRHEEGLTKYTVDDLIDRYGVTGKVARRAILTSVIRGYVEHNGDPERGWLSETGIALLTPEQQAAYRKIRNG